MRCLAGQPNQHNSQVIVWTAVQRAGRPGNAERPDTVTAGDCVSLHIADAIAIRFRFALESGP